ncbi:hypothetical protein ACR2R6_14150 [Methylocaldum gracile subsp. desertum]|uniref:hypothetical protein n=1 Tax=Methylocaldum sp. GT1BW TaxID=3438964 RepID=UPI003DA06673
MLKAVPEIRAIVRVWLLAIATVAFIVLVEPSPEETWLDVARLLIPLAGIVTIMRLQIQNSNAGDAKEIAWKILRGLIAVPFFILGINWLWLFSLTDYRSHQRMIIIPLAIIFILIAVLLIHFRGARGKGKPV